jgi:DNA-binding Xre family transcriptional regulator
MKIIKIKELNEICIKRLSDKTEDVLEYFNQTHEITIQRS